MISVIIPAYKNTQELVKNLGKNLPHLKGCEVIVVNDFPGESIKNSLKGLDVKLVENKRNLGFAGAVNAGVEISTGEYLMFLNSDVILHDDSYKKTLASFREHRDLFAVSFAQKEEGDRLVGKNRIFWDLGIVRHSKARDLEYGETGWAEGGACIVDREKFLKLGGLDTLYSPFYWEDIDLSYRAWKAGYRILFDPTVVVTHHHESTIGKFFDKKKVQRIAFRNQHIFIIKNISDMGLSFSYWFLLLPNCIYHLLKKEPEFFLGFVDAFLRFFKIQSHRTKQRKYFILQDNKVFSHFT